MALLSVERIIIERDRMIVLVRVSGKNPATRCLGEEGAERLRKARPSLMQHDCLNANGVPFDEILPSTSLPHVLEHLIIDFQVADSTVVARSACSASSLRTVDPRGRAVTFLGTTEWLLEAEGLARIEVNFVDDLVALSALKHALALIEGMVETS